MERKFLRIVYAAEFLLALIAVYTAWSQIGGQGHLDLMAWYLKLCLGLAMAYAIVSATAAAAGDERAWNGKTLRWLGILALFAAVAGVATYYYHLYEPSDDQDEQQTTESSIRAAGTFVVFQGRGAAVHVTASPSAIATFRERQHEHRHSPIVRDALMDVGQ
jgi:hypothetical protein